MGLNFYKVTLKLIKIDRIDNRGSVGLMHNTVRGTSIAVPDTVRGNESDYLDTSKFTRATEEKNPCWEESKVRIALILVSLLIDEDFSQLFLLN